MRRKGILLAGGSGTRLYPSTLSVSKQLLPVYDKPMIFYPISLLILSGVEEILIITTEYDQPMFKKLLGNGSQWGVSFSFVIQKKPDGLAQAYILAADFLNNFPSILALGDNIFFGHGFKEIVKNASNSCVGSTIFGYQVAEPSRFGVAEFDPLDQLVTIKEKPIDPKSDWAITGLYLTDNTAPYRAKQLRPSERGELEITDLLISYIEDDLLIMEKLGRGIAWLDTGTPKSLLEASNYVQSVTSRQGLLIGSPDEVSLRMGLIDREILSKNIRKYGNSDYANLLKKLLTD